MPTIIRRSNQQLIETRREILHAVSWQVHSSVWSPPTDMYEAEDTYIIRVEIAGMREEDIEVAVEDNILMISGSRPDAAERRAYHQMEIRFGKFTTSIGLPGPINMETSTAEYRDGFLTVTLPRVKPSQIRVE